MSEMSLRDLLLILLVALPCGALAQITSAFSRKGWFLHLGLAYMGGFIGVVLARSVDVPAVYLLRLGTYEFPLIWALLGSVLLVAATGVLIRPSRR